MAASDLKFNTASRSVARSSGWTHRLAYINRELPRAIAGVIQNVPFTKGGKVLDYGCADMPYRNLLPRNCEYLGADLPGNPHANIEIGDDGILGVADASIDLVLSSQVLEHVEDPRRYLDECWRVLKPGGALILSTHGLMTYHRDPVDYWRWTGDGLKKTVTAHGFLIEEFKGVMGLAPTGLQLFQDATLAGLPRFFWRPYCFVMQLSIAVFDKMHSVQSRERNALVYIVRAKKLL